MSTYFDIIPYDLVELIYNFKHKKEMEKLMTELKKKHTEYSKHHITCITYRSYGTPQEQIINTEYNPNHRTTLLYHFENWFHVTGMGYAAPRGSIINYLHFLGSSSKKEYLTYYTNEGNVEHSRLTKKQLLQILFKHNNIPFKKSKTIKELVKQLIKINFT